MEINLKNRKPDIRFLNDMKMVLSDQKWAKKAPNHELYYMYRGVKKKGRLINNITVTFPRMLGKEFAKTMGHEHQAGYGELYIVLSGQAIFLSQKHKNGKIEDVFAIKAKKGEVAIIPPDYGHVMINPSKNKELKTGDWSDKKRQNLYGPFIKKHGACYYYTEKGWIKNKEYVKVPKLRFEKPLKRLPKNLDFLHGN